MQTVVGLMSGTSMDGIDAALVRTDGERRVEPLAFVTVSYEDDFRANLRSCLGGKGPVEAVERALTDAHADAVRRPLAEAGTRAAAGGPIGLPGPTDLPHPAPPPPLPLVPPPAPAPATPPDRAYDSSTAGWSRGRARGSRR
ncbi:hypothetical protein GAY28_35785, partial [Azospirillum brasilense]|nr:hypothetical protein [Azospirillum brasilense]